MPAGSSDVTFSSAAAFDTAPASPQPLHMSFTGAGWNISVSGSLMYCSYC
ncbi:hypothetical protein MNJPNG_14770 [Cupriavidus oxalaticus]